MSFCIWTPDYRLRFSLPPNWKATVIVTMKGVETREVVVTQDEVVPLTRFVSCANGGMHVPDGASKEIVISNDETGLPMNMSVQPLFLPEPCAIPPRKAFIPFYMGGIHTCNIDEPKLKMSSWIFVTPTTNLVGIAVVIEDEGTGGGRQSGGSGQKRSTKAKAALRRTMKSASTSIRKVRTEVEKIPG